MAALTKGRYMGIFDKMTFQMPCECGDTVEKSVKYLRNNSDYECKCGRTIEIQGNFTEAMASADKTISDFKKGIAKLSRRR